MVFVFDSENFSYREQGLHRDGEGMDVQPSFMVLSTLKGNAIPGGFSLNSPSPGFLPHYGVSITNSFHREWTSVAPGRNDSNKPLAYS